jgi:hypothetical protein
MPPCAATVCERVGKTLVTQAVEALLGGAEGGAEARAAGADDDDVVFVIDEFQISHAIRLRTRREAGPSPAPDAR